MKQLLLIFTFSFLFSLSSSAQFFAFGIKGGPSLVDIGAIHSNGTFNGASFAKARLSYHVGFFGNANISSKLYLQVELLYANKGFRNDDPNGNKAHLHFHYLTLPVLLNYRILENLHIEVGGELGYRIAARSKLEKTTLDVGGIYDRKVDLGVIAGIKYKINEQVKVGIRGIYGLSNLFKNPIVVPGEEEALKLNNQGVQFSVSYELMRRFRLR